MLFMIEVAPYAVYERILPAEYRSEEYKMTMPSTEILPQIEMKRYGGDRTFHLMGQAACLDLEDPKLNINLRYFNPTSPLYDKAASQKSVLIHEIMHMQGICTDSSKGDEFNKDVETATQLATVETLAAMTRHKNKHALLPFLREVQGYAADLVLMEALEDDFNLESYEEKIVDPTANDVFRKAGWAKSMDHWMESYDLQFRLKEIVRDYGYKPYLYMIEALNDEDYETRKLPFPNPRGKMAMNDTAYCLEHIDDLVDSYVEIWGKDTCPDG